MSTLVSKNIIFIAKNFMDMLKHMFLYEKNIDSVNGTFGVLFCIMFCKLR